MDKKLPFDAVDFCALVVDGSVAFCSWQRFSIYVVRPCSKVSSFGKVGPRLLDEVFGRAEIQDLGRHLYKFRCCCIHLDNMIVVDCSHMGSTELEYPARYYVGFAMRVGEDSIELRGVESLLKFFFVICARLVERDCLADPRTRCRELISMEELSDSASDDI